LDDDRAVFILAKDSATVSTTQALDAIVKRLKQLEESTEKLKKDIEQLLTAFEAHQQSRADQGSPKMRSDVPRPPEASAQ